MIDPKELRIGNWLQGKPFNAPRMGISSNGETQITGEGIAAIERRLITNYSYSPIPLTPEWLERLGFVNERRNIYSKEGIYLIQYDESVIYLAGPRHVNIHYVHSLQNLFFSLTGEEL